jgi:AraC-like DNA-binding protein
VDVAVLDPGADGVVRVEHLIEVVRRYPSLPVVIYTVLTPQSLRAVVELSNHGLQQVVLHRFDDEPRRFLETLEQQPGVSLSEALLDRLLQPLAKLPTALVRAVERMYRRPSGFADASDLAREAGMPRRTLYRVLETAGFAHPSVVVRGARLLRAYSYLRDPGHLVDDVATKLGYSNQQRFAKHVRETFGVTPLTLRRTVSPEECVSRLAAILYPEAGTLHIHPMSSADRAVDPPGTAGLGAPSDVDREPA